VNPKDVVGSRKLPLHLVPEITKAYLALAHGEGALKYGPYNWRESGVKVSTYVSALGRHVGKYVEGEWADPQTHVPHLASALACLSIIVDAKAAGVLIDDRPLPSIRAREFIGGEGEVVWQTLLDKETLNRETGMDGRPRTIVCHDGGSGGGAHERGARDVDGASDGAGDADRSTRKPGDVTPVSHYDIAGSGRDYGWHNLYPY
jgi:hypothetical protein